MKVETISGKLPEENKDLSFSNIINIKILVKKAVIIVNFDVIAFKHFYINYLKLNEKDEVVNFNVIFLQKIMINILQVEGV